MGEICVFEQRNNVSKEFELYFSGFALKIGMEMDGNPRIGFLFFWQLMIDIVLQWCVQEVHFVTYLHRVS